MTLTSQQSRPSNPALYSTGPRKKSALGPGKIAGIVLLLTVVGAAVWYFALSSASPRKSLASNTTSHTGPSTNPLAAPSQVQRNLREPSPTVISMTGPARPGTSPTPAPAASTALTSATSLAQAQPVTPTNTPPTTPTPAPITTTPSPAQPGATPPTSTPPVSPAPGSTQPGTGGPPAQPGQPGGGGMNTPPPAPPPSAVQLLLADAQRLQAANKLVDTRAALNKALLDPSASDSDRAAIRKWMAELNQTLVFSPTVAPGDTLCDTYTVVSGDNIEKIMRKQNLLPDKMLIARVNKMADPNRLSVGQKLKVVKGPFHAVVSKSQFRIDIYAGDVPSPAAPTMLPSSSSSPEGVEPGWLYITSFPVGLGERSPDGKGGTPLGNFVVKPGSKLMNPHWTNPRTGEKFGADDPKNPIGERWMGLEGRDDASKKFTGYGIHGTIDPASIGKEMSMGCVRLNSADIEVVYELLTSKVSIVKIVP